jgi:formylglycine-generating enzyme required for sulfatase activity
VPAGCFMMGSDQGNPDERPVHQQCFDRPFWIDVTEVTNARFGSAWDSSGDDYPREAVKWFHARDYCKDRGTRLPTEAEWEYAARGPNSLRYPWGDTFEGNNLVYSGNSNGHSAPVGGRQGGVSWVGALDLVGNVWEWVSSIYRPYPYDASDGREDASDQTSIRVWRGGSYSSYAEFLNPTARRNGDPSWEYNNGFRCARDWSPSDTTP